MSLPIRKETCDDGDFTISNFANGMRSAYVLGIKLQSQLSVAYVQDQSISIYWPAYFAPIICWCFYIIKTQTRSSRVLFLFFYSRAQFVDFVCKIIWFVLTQCGLFYTVYNYIDVMLNFIIGDSKVVITLLYYKEVSDQGHQKSFPGHRLSS